MVQMGRVVLAILVLSFSGQSWADEITKLSFAELLQANPIFDLREIESGISSAVTDPDSEDIRYRNIVTWMDQNQWELETEVAETLLDDYYLVGESNRKKSTLEKHSLLLRTLVLDSYRLAVRDRAMRLYSLEVIYLILKDRSGSNDVFRRKVAHVLDEFHSLPDEHADSTDPSDLHYLRGLTLAQFEERSRVIRKVLGKIGRRYFPKIQKYVKSETRLGLKVNWVTYRLCYGLLGEDGI